MAVNLVTVTGKLETLVGGTPYLGRLWFRLNRADWNLSGDIFAPEYIEAVADAVTGAFSVALQSTSDFEAGASYSVILKYREPLDARDREYTVAQFMLPVGGPYQLGDLLTLPFVEPVPADILALCQAYALAASASATSSYNSATAASLSAATAQARWVETFAIAGISNPITLGVVPVSKSLVDVRIDGVSQLQADFSLSGAQLTFTGGWPVGADNVEVVYYGSVLDRNEAIALAAAINTTPSYLRADAVALVAAENAYFLSLDAWFDENGNAYKLSAGATTLTGLPGFIPLAPYHLFQWGVVPIANDGSTAPTVNYAAHMQAAHDYVAANGGGAIRTGAGTIGFGSTVYWGDGAAPVLLQGEGRGGISSSAVLTKASAGTRLRWIGAAAGTGFVLTSDRADSGLKSRGWGGGLVDFMLDGASTGGWGLKIMSHSGHRLHLHFNYWKKVHMLATCLLNGIVAGPSDNQSFCWNIHTSDVNASAANQALAHVAIHGISTANTSLGVIEEMRISAESHSVGAHFGDMDGMEIRVFTSGTRLAAVGDGGKLILHANDSFPATIAAAAGNCRYNTFTMTQCVDGITAKNGASPSGPNSILELSKGNGSPLPVIEAGALLSYTSGADGIRVPALLLPGQSAFSNYIAGGTAFSLELADAATAGNVSATAATASYGRIGNMVFVSARFIDISTAGLTAGNDVYLRGLPFAGSVLSFGGGTIYANSLTFTGQITPILNSASPTTLRISKTVTGVNSTYVKVSDITSGTTDLYLNFWYFI